MRYMNEFDLHNARQYYVRGTQPNRLALVMVVDALRNWADQNSDGWAYWPKPVRAASKAMELIDGREATDVTNAEMMAAVKPIKAFLTRQRVEATDRERILRAVA